MRNILKYCVRASVDSLESKGTFCDAFAYDFKLMNINVPNKSIISDHLELYLYVVVTYMSFPTTYINLIEMNKAFKR